MAKPKVSESRFDWRGGRNTAISPDLLNPNELVDCTNAVLTQSYGGFGKRAGSQRIHNIAFPAAVMGTTQWDTLSGKQTVAISNGDLYWRNGFNFTPSFTKVATTAVARTTANQGVAAGWNDPDGINNGQNSLLRTSDGTSTIAAGNRLYIILGDPAADGNLPAVDNLYTVKFRIFINGLGIDDPLGMVVTGTVTLEYSLNSGVAWSPLAGSYTTQCGWNQSSDITFNPTVEIVAGAAPIWIRFILTLTTLNMSGGSDPSANATLISFSGTYPPANQFPTTWSTGAARFSLTEPTFFMPFRASTAGAPLVLYMASGGHYFSWDGVSTLTQIDTTSAPPLAKLLISYHTRAFALDRNYPKTVFWSEIGNATNFGTGDKTKGGSALTDFLTGQELIAMEVVGSSLLLATHDSIVRFSGHASDDIVIFQDTEGVSAEVGCVGPQAFKRFENVAAVLSERGPYAVLETHVEPIGEQLNPDWLALDQDNLDNAVIEYNRSDKDLLFAVAQAGNGGENKSIYAYAPRLQAWQGPWTYTFGIKCMSKYFNSSSAAPQVIAGCTDGYVRVLDTGTMDDVLYNGTGGSNITMTTELPTMHFGDPGITKTVRQMLLQAKIPAGSNLKVLISFDGGPEDEGSFLDTTFDGTLRHYRVDVNGTGKRCKVRFTDDSSKSPMVNGFVLQAYNMQRP